jgi:hypothetical protein
MNGANKIREILPSLDKAIVALTRLSADAAKLEYLDNDEASRRLKRDIKDFEQNDFYPLKKLVINIRAEINSKPARKRAKKEIPLAEEKKPWEHSNNN